jgi:hypothetical protein
MTIYSLLHHTIPLLADRLADMRIESILLPTPSTNFLREHVETLIDEIENFVIGQLAIKAVFEQMNIQFWESMEFIGALCGANTSTEIMMGALDREIETIDIENVYLRQPLQKSLTRERTRDQTIET